LGFDSFGACASVTAAVTTTNTATVTAATVNAATITAATVTATVTAATITVTAATVTITAAAVIVTVFLVFVLVFVSVLVLVIVIVFMVVVMPKVLPVGIGRRHGRMCVFGRKGLPVDTHGRHPPRGEGSAAPASGFRRSGHEHQQADQAEHDAKNESQSGVQDLPGRLRFAAGNR
jgi:hypothetical protein